VTKKIAKREFGLMRFFILVKKELASIWADKQALLIVFILPLLAVVAVGVTGAAADKTIDMLTAGRQADLGYVNLDRSVGYPNYVLSDEFIAVLGRQPGVTLTKYDTVAEANESLYRENIIGYVVLRDGFEMNVSAHLPAFVECHADAVYILAQPLVTSKVNDAIKEFKIAFNLLEDEINYETQDLWHIRSPLFVAWPMILTLTLMASALMLATQSMVGDNPIMRVALTPSRKFEIVSAKVAAYTILEMMQSLVLILFPMFLFNLNYPGNFFAIWIFSIFISYCGVAMGVFLSSLAKTKLQGSQFFLVGFMAIFILGSGVFVSGPEKIFPMIYSMNGSALVAYKDLPFALMWPYIWPQLAFGTIFYLAAYIVFRLKKGAI